MNGSESLIASKDSEFTWSHHFDIIELTAATAKINLFGTLEIPEC